MDIGRKYADPYIIGNLVNSAFQIYAVLLSDISTFLEIPFRVRSVQKVT